MTAPYSTVSPEELIQACVTNAEGAAWEEFMHRYHRLIAGVVFRTAQQWGQRSATVIDDLIQDTYLRLCAEDFRLLRRYEPKHPNAIFGYLKQITANITHDQLKALHTEKRGGNQIAEDLAVLDDRIEPSEVFGSQNAMEREILLSEIEAVLQAGLSEATGERDRTIFWLYYRQGLTTRAIASIPTIGLTIKGVESTIFRLTGLVRKGMVEGSAA